MRLTIAALAICLLLVSGTGSSVTAQDTQTDAMIWHFNVYRMQNGAPPLYTHLGLSTLLQDSAQQSADACGPIIPAKPSYASQWTFFAENGGATADIRWNYDWLLDPMYTSRVANPDFNSVGVGLALSRCSQGWTWTAALAKISGVPGGAIPTPTGPVQPTPLPTSVIRGDTNCNGVVEASDALLILQRLAGFQEFPNCQ